jgi:hypothetical protein
LNRRFHLFEAATYSRVPALIEIPASDLYISSYGLTSLLPIKKIPSWSVLLVEEIRIPNKNHWSNENHLLPYDHRHDSLLEIIHVSRCIDHFICYSRNVYIGDSLGHVICLLIYFRLAVMLLNIWSAFVCTRLYVAASNKWNRRFDC